jgi:hypothetical protein
MTSEINIKELFGSRIEKLWDDTKFQNPDLETIKKRGFAIPEKIKTGSILFVGINPSYDEKKGNTYYLNDDYKDGKPHPYFNKFVEIKKRTDDVLHKDWTHIDLTFVRETKQRKIHDFGCEEGQKFIEEQMKIFKDIIEQSKPYIIIVNNTLARDWIKKYNIFQTEFSEKFGTPVITSGVLKNTPIFFTSMLTGQRALDMGSFYRLVWHIKYVHNIISKEK